MRKVVISWAVVATVIQELKGATSLENKFSLSPPLPPFKDAASGPGTTLGEPLG